MKTALIVGVDSVIGFHLRQTLQDVGWEVYATTRRKESTNAKTLFLDLAQLTLPISIRADVVFLCASITKIAQCEEDVVRATQINQHAQIALAEYFLSCGSHVIFLSTNAVFDGHKPHYRVDDRVNPLTVYGQSKAAVEAYLRSQSGLISIIRLSKVFTNELPLIKQWSASLKEGRAIHPYDDLYVCPISMKMVLYCLKLIAEKQLLGMMHLSGEKDISYYHVALCLANNLNVSPHLVVATSMQKDKNTSSEQGPYGSLDMQASFSQFELQDRSVQTVLNDLRCY